MEAETLTGIFRDNPHLCCKVTESEVQYFIHCIEKKRHVKFLQFLQTVVQGAGKGGQAKGQQSKRIQDMVMNEVCENFAIIQGRITSMLLLRKLLYIYTCIAYIHMYIPHQLFEVVL